MRDWIIAVSFAVASVLLVGEAYSQSRPITKTLQSAQGGNQPGESITVDGYSTVGLQVTISGAATVNFEGTQDLNTWASVTCVTAGDTNFSVIVTTTTTKTVLCPVAGFTKFRARTSGNTGSVTVTATASDGVLSISSSSGGGGGGGGVITDIQDSTSTTTLDSTNHAVRVSPVTAIQLTNIVPSSSLTLQKAGFNITTATTTTIISATAGQTVNVYGLWFYPGDLACDITLQDSGATNLITAGATIDVLANQGANFQLQADPWFTSASGTGVQIVTGAACHLVGIVYYTKG